VYTLARYPRTATWPFIYKPFLHTLPAKCETN
jgi:hypothetical protein